MKLVRLLASAASVLRREGPGGLLRRALHNRRYHRAQRAIDRRYGTETLEWVSLDRFSVTDPSRYSAYEYGPVTALLFNEVIDRLPISAAAHVFIDLGCGKGLALMLAADQGFGHVIGVEFEPTLCAQARVNLARFGERHSGKLTVEIIEQDAGTFDYPAAPLVLFLNNPFGPEVVGRMLATLRASLAAAPRACWIVYFHPLHRVLMDGSDFLRLHAERVDAGEDDYVVYTAAPPE